MRNRIWILGLTILVGCGTDTAENNANEPLPVAVDFFSDWLEAHGHTDVVVDAQGVGISGNATRLSASVYGSNQLETGGFVVETEFRVRLPSGREIVEFVAGIGDTQEQAINDSMLNFTLTTFHAVYKGFINDDDPHMTSKHLSINGQQREVILGDIYMRGGPASKQFDLNAMQDKIEDALTQIPLTEEQHWIKIVYSQLKSEPSTVSATTDNAEDRALTTLVTNLDWPRSDEFYMVKQFVVVK